MNSNNENYAKIAQLELLVNKFHTNIDQYNRTGYNETEVRIDFINPFFEILGWDVMNENGLPQHLREVVHEATVIVKENGIHRSKKPDYSFKIGTEILFFVETKKPSVNITIDREPAFQLRRYGWSGNLKISVLTNFKDLFIYDCSVRPVENDEIGRALIAHYHYSEYVEKFHEIYNLLSKESVLNGDFDRVFSNIQGSYRREPFDQYFLEQIKQWRVELGQDIVNNNNINDAASLNIIVQRILNRIIFLRICEDRNFESYETLKHISTYKELKQLFEIADKKYDSGLFDLLGEENIIISDKTIINIFRDLYYPNNSYEFGVIDPYIIGQIYELFLDEALEINKNREIVVVEKPEVIASQGTVNTPKNITDIIVEQTLCHLYKNKDIEDVKSYRIADICCGSGNFLISAFEYITNYYVEYFKTHDIDSAIKRGDIYRLPGSTDYNLSYELKREILENNIWGIDIDPLAVEVTKFSLSLKALEGTSIEEVSAFTVKRNVKILPNLDSNICNGNSLVDSQFTKFNANIYHDFDLMDKIKMFDWSSEFGGEKFDAIIGNPPYIRVQNMVQYSPDEYAYYKSNISNYVTAQAELLDKYYLFIERGLSLLKSNGFLGYIVPHKFMNIQSGRVLREYLSVNGNVKKILHFGTHQAFKNRSTYTCILILSKQRSEEFEIAFVNDLNKLLFQHDYICEKHPMSYLSSQPWVFLPRYIMEALEGVQKKCLPLVEFAEIFVGVQTSADKIYIIKSIKEDEKYIYYETKDKEIGKIEKGIVRKSIYDAKLEKYEKIEANSYIIFPYKFINNKPVLYSIDEMQTQFPETYKYLQQYRNVLDNRNMPSRTEETWYAYGRSQSIGKFMSGEHLIWPVLSLSSNYVYDNEMVVFTGGGNGPFYGLRMKPNVKESIFYIQALLNHWLLELLVKNKASTFRGNYYSHGKQFVAALPIYKINFNNSEESYLHDKIVTNVKTIMQLSEQYKKEELNSSRKDTIKRTIDILKKENDNLIGQLYGVSLDITKE